MAVTRLRVLLAALAAAAAALATSAAPAAAAASSGGAELDCTLFDSVSALATGAAAARGDQAREPVLNEPVQALPASAPVPGPGFSVTIPVNFHVIHDGGVGNVTQAQIDDQIRVLSLGFSDFYGKAPTGLRVHARERDANGQRRMVQRRAGLARRARDEEDAQRRRPVDPGLLLDDRVRVPQMGVLPRPVGAPPVPSTGSSSTGSRCSRRPGDLRGTLRPRLHRRPRGRTLARAVPRSRAAATRRATTSTTRRP